MDILHYNDEEHELHAYLAQRGHVNTVVSSGEDPILVAKKKRFDAAFIGLHPQGMALMRELHQSNSDCCVTIITSDTNTRSAVQAIKAGAFDYLISPLDFSEVERVCLLMARDESTRIQRRELEDQLAAIGSPRLVGESERMRQLSALIGKAAMSNAPVLICGETGTGKEMIARLLHDQSPRSQRSFVSVNCNAIPSTLLESELFGYRRGAFTGAVTDRLGLLAEADGGTFLFDEISDLEPALQGKILRALQDGEILPVGASQPQFLDVRFVAATNVDLKSLVRAKRFREDLFYRLNVIPIFVPPLRERREDVVVLARHFIDGYSRRAGRAPLKITVGVWRWMAEYDWPGNVRELENLCHRAVALADGDDFDTDILGLTETLGAGNTILLSVEDSGDTGLLQQSRERVEHDAIEQALTRHSGNISMAAKNLGISRTTFYAKMRKLGINVERRTLRRTSN